MHEQYTQMDDYPLSTSYATSSPSFDRYTIGVKQYTEVLVSDDEEEHGNVECDDRELSKVRYVCALTGAYQSLTSRSQRFR